MPAVRYPTVLFDWDGCLLASLDAWLGAFESTCVRFGIEPPTAAIKAQFGSWDLWELGISVTDERPFLEELGREADRTLRHAALADGADDLLTALRSGGAQVALVTSSWRQQLLPTLDRLGLADAFDTVVAADDVTDHKPAAEPIRTALAAIGAGSEGAVMIGDSTKDLGAARNAGIDSVLIHGDSHAAFHDLAELRALAPTHVVASFAELTDLLLPA